MNFNDFKLEMLPYHNHICLLYDSEIVRLIGVAEDILDFYYIVQSEDKEEEFWATAVGHCVSLKEVNYPRYTQIENRFVQNGKCPTESFIVEKASDLKNWKTYNIKTNNGVIDEIWMNQYRNLMEELNFTTD